jgi:hypothetical protein
MPGLSVFQRLRPLAQVHPAPVFLLGHPKSGTSVIAALLGELCGHAVTEDLFRTTRIRKNAARRLFSGELSLADFVRRHSRSFATPLNKCPKLTYFHRELRSCFPMARFIYIVRDPRASLRSFLGWRAIPGNAESLDDPAQLARVEVLPRQPPGHYVCRLASRWNQAADVYLQQREEFVLVRYEDFLPQPQVAIWNLAVAVGLQPRHDISGRVHIGHKVSGVRHVPFEKFFGEANLGRIESTCGERMRAFGYA